MAGCRDAARLDRARRLQARRPADHLFAVSVSLRYDRRRAELEKLIADKKSDYYRDKKALAEPDEYRRVGAFIILENARWQNLRKGAQADDIKVRLDDVLEALETNVPGEAEGSPTAHLCRLQPGRGRCARPDQSLQHAPIDQRARAFCTFVGEPSIKSDGAIQLPFK